MSRRKYFRFWRTIIPASFLVITVVLLHRLASYPLPEDARWLMWLSRLDPLPLFSSIRGGTGVPLWLWLPLLVLGATLLMGRVFCGWLCPVGGLLGLIDASRRLFVTGAVRNRTLSRLLDWLKGVRYYWLGLLLLTLLLGAGWPMLLTPHALLSHEVTFMLNKQIPWLFLLLFFSAITLFPRFWCTYLCPSGMFFSGFSRWRRFGFKVNENCNNCGLCNRQCPTGAIEAKPGAVVEDCLMCGRCWEECPRNAVVWGSLRDEQKIDNAEFGMPGEMKPPDESVLFTRRDIVQAGTVIIAAGVLWPTSMTSAEAGFLRPPGALLERDFSARCSRCGRCIRTCPNQALQPVSIFCGIGYYGTPHLVPRIGRCDLDACFLCMEVCPTGAIQQVPLEKVRIGTADLDHKLCLNWNGQTRCLLCLEQCPVQAISTDALQRPQVDSRTCVGCGACENGCPVKGAAIHVKLVKKIV